MDFREFDLGEESWTWAGSEAEYWLLLKDAYKAIKEVDPDATVLFGATTYWVDRTQGRELYVQRVLDVAVQDPEAFSSDWIFQHSGQLSGAGRRSASNGWFFDVLAMNIYRAPDDMYRIGVELDAVLESFGINKPRWITEHNCMPFDDPHTPRPDDGQRCTLQEQAAYVIQAHALAFGAGWERTLWYQLTDNQLEQWTEAWGLVRDDGSERPAFQAFRTAVRYFANAERVTFRPLTRTTHPWISWPDDPTSYYPNWLVYQVVLDRGGDRVNVLWNGSGAPLRVRVPRQGASAMLVDKLGNQHPLADQDGWYVVDLAAATTHGPADPPDYHYVGGDPLLVVQQGVPLGAEVVEPVLVD